MPIDERYEKTPEKKVHKFKLNLRRLVSKKRENLIIGYFAGTLTMVFNAVVNFPFIELHRVPFSAHNFFVLLIMS